MMFRFRNQFSTPPVVLNLLIINILFFLAAEAFPERAVNMLYHTLGLHFWRSPDFHLWQLFTCMFLHGGITHLFMNMFALWMFGRTLEYDLGSRRFLSYYMLCGIGASLIQSGVYEIEYVFAASEMARFQIGNSLMFGASGAVFGVLLAFGMMHPNAMIILLIPPIPMKAKWFVIGYGVLELILGVSRTASSIAHFAHVGGMLFGFFLLLLWRKQRVF